LSKQASAAPRPVTQLRPEVPPAVVNVVSRALAKRVEERYQTAGELAADLRTAMGEPLRLLTPPDEVQPLWDALPGTEASTAPAWGRWLVAAALIALLVLAVLRLWPALANGLSR
jgi:hypothetical protein